MTVLQCGKILASWKEQQLRCCRKAGHKGSHKLSQEDERESSRMWARFVRLAIEKPDA